MSHKNVYMQHRQDHIKMTRVTFRGLFLLKQVHYVPHVSSIIVTTNRHGLHHCGEWNICNQTVQWLEQKHWIYCKK